MIMSNMMAVETASNDTAIRFADLDPRAALRRAWAANRSLTFLGVAMLLSLLVSLIGIVLDPRIITGAQAWLKPAKFGISIAIYSFTLLWLLTFVQGRPRLVGLVSVA